MRNALQLGLLAAGLLERGEWHSPNCSARRDTRGTAISQKVQIPSSSPSFCSHDGSLLSTSWEGGRTQKEQPEHCSWGGLQHYTRMVLHFKLLTVADDPPGPCPGLHCLCVCISKDYAAGGVPRGSSTAVWDLLHGTDPSCTLAALEINTHGVSTAGWQQTSTVVLHPGLLFPCKGVP